MRKTIGIIAIIALASAGATAQEQAHMKRAERSLEHDGQRGQLQELMNSIPGITEEQKSTLKQIFIDTRKATEPSRTELRKVSAELKTLREASQPDMARVNSLIDRKHALKAEIAKARAAAEAKAMGVLNPEQQAAYKAAKKERHAKHKEQGKREQGQKPRPEHRERLEDK